MVKLRCATPGATPIASPTCCASWAASTRSWTLREPSPGALRSALARAEQRAAVDPKLELLVDYSGHADGRGLLLGNEQFGYEELRQTLVRSRASVRVAVLDACHAGGR